jgi:hypothetical protein
MRPLYQFLERWSNRGYIWCGAFRSFRGHIRIQSPRELPKVEYGPAPLLFSDGSVVEQPRTIARQRCTRRLLAIYPWADMSDLRIFLMGFDAGERWMHDTAGIQSRTHQQQESWLDLVAEE